MNQPIDSVTRFFTQPSGPLFGGGQPPQDPGPAFGVGVSEPPPAFIEAWRAVMLRKWWIMLFALVVAALAAWVVGMIKPVYRSTATVLIESSKAKVVSVDDVYQGATANREYYQTQAEAIKSRSIAVKVVQKLDLTRNPEFDPRQRHESPVLQWVKDAVPAATPYLPTRKLPKDDAELLSTVLRSFEQRLSVEPVRLSQLVKVSFEANDPELAAAVANEVAGAFINADIEARLKITQNAGSMLSERLAELKAKADASERAVQAYREREGLLDSKVSPLSGEGRRMDDLTQKLVEARVKRLEAEEQYNQVKGGEASGYESVPAVIRHPGVQRAREFEAEAQKKMDELRERYGPDHPKLVAAQAELNSAKANTRRQVQAVVASVSREYNVARATEQMIEEALAKTKSAIQGLNRKEIQVAVLEREAQANQQLYQQFLQRSKETKASSEVQQPLARVIDLATPGLRPVRPAKAETVAISAVLALLIGVIAAIAHKQLNNRINTREEVETKLYQPLLAAMPVMSGKARASSGTAVVDAPHELFSESIRTASTGILLSTLDAPKKVIAVTSSVPGEGKSTCSMNLALFQAKSGKKTLLVEADMRRPGISRAMRLPDGQKGLSELVAGTAPKEECILVNEATGLHVLTAGTIPPNPLELLVSQRFQEVLAQLREDYEMIIIDTPPLQLVSDALMVGKECTGLIYVVKANDTPVPLVRSGLKRVIAAHIPVVGVILNQLDYKKAERYYGDYSGYGKYGYGKYGKYGYGKYRNGKRSEANA